MSNIINKAMLFAMNAHAGTTRKGTDIPYILHPLEVSAIVATMTSDHNVIAAAILHDVLEDTAVTSEEVEKEFGSRILALVRAESENKREDLPPEETWVIRKQETIDYIANFATREQKIVALGDKLSNLRAINRDYKEIGNKLWKRFNQKDPVMHKWYYSSFLETCAELKKFDAYQEYKKLIEEVFEK